MRYEPAKSLELLPGAVEAGAALLQEDAAACDRFDRVAALVEMKHQD
jgi:hypothetical protein